ncbi:signal peptidase I [Brevibacterium album]|uniref:signal peptidase I n=1 Tax=Brevibacterium album TaxID=417948 RepID=UPI0004120CA1|nr:signal peptidase I [Brevibacterium album]
MNPAARSARAHSAGASARRPGALSRLLGAVLNVAAAGGAVCILLVILALVMNVSLILFRTGSMDPTIPQGSLAVVREIPAAEVSVGDIVTVDREGKLPVTHRVIDIADTGGGATRITMQGDANPVPDPAPYDVTSVRTVLFSVPGLAAPVAALGSPYVLGSVTLAVSALVVWALWPRRREGEEIGVEAGGGAAEAEVSAPRSAAP